MVPTRQGSLVDNAFVIAILGPTASGKSEIAQQVALALNGEVVSADSMQVYRGMDIGTAKVPITERLVPHHLIDILDPGEPFSAQVFQKMARECFSFISAQGKVALLCGGTGLYVQAALEDMRFPKGDQIDNPVRAKYEQIAQNEGNQAVWDILHNIDPKSAEILHVNNTRRVIRALEMHAQGISYADQVKNIKQLPEVVPSPQAIGYKEIVYYLDGDITQDEAIEQIKTATRRYAKRQRTWLRRDSRLTMLDADTLSREQIVSIIIDNYNNQCINLRK